MAARQKFYYAALSLPQGALRLCCALRKRETSQTNPTPPSLSAVGRVANDRCYHHEHTHRAPISPGFVLEATDSHKESSNASRAQFLQRVSADSIALVGAVVGLMGEGTQGRPANGLYLRASHQLRAPGVGAAGDE